MDDVDALHERNVVLYTDSMSLLAHLRRIVFAPSPVSSAVFQLLSSIQRVARASQRLCMVYVAGHAGSGFNSDAD